MGAADRTVQHLHLRAPTAQAAVHAVHRLDDALRCASLPDAGERVLLVRRLHLGRLPEGLSTQSLGLLIEQRVAALGGEWVHGDEERAAHSDTVFFASRLQAAQAALRRRSRGVDLKAWYWPLALPGVAVQAAPGVFLEQLVQRLGAEPGAPATLPALVAHGVVAGAARWLAQHLGAAALECMMATVGERPIGRPRDQLADVPPTVADTVWRDAVGQRQWVPVDASVSRWLPAVLRAAGWRALPGSAQPEVRECGVTVSAAMAPTRASVTDRLAPPRTARGASPKIPKPRPPAASPDAEAPADPAFVSMPARPQGADGACSPGLPAEHLATLAGGLLFLLPVLERLGFAAWQAQQPGQPLCATILRLALRCLRVPLSDPAWALVASLPAPTEENEATADDTARRWLIALRRHLRRVGGLGLAGLCLRSAHLAWTDTHVDVHFALAAADLRVRRLALDVDPGWLPWLHRVVAFHFQREGWA